MAEFSLMRSHLVRSQWALACVLLAMNTGCSLTCPWCSSPKVAEPLPVNEVVAYWDNHVHVTTDVVRGANLPGLAGRVCLFNREAKQALEATGTMMIEMYDMTPVAAGGQPNKVADWTFDAASLKQLKRTDLFGDGYTIFLPWETYRPEVNRLKIQIHYVSNKGVHYLAEAEEISLQGNNDRMTIENRRVIPGQQVTPAQYLTPAQFAAPERK